MTRRHFKRFLTIIALVVLLSGIPACFRFAPMHGSTPSAAAGPTTASPMQSGTAASGQIYKFAVISDLHYYDTSLGTTGQAYQQYVGADDKLLQYSSPLLDCAIDSILKSGVQFVLAAGDLTKDGELIDHEELAQALKRLTNKGIKVYVVPGNHDIENPNAYRYEGKDVIPVPNVTPEQFSYLYKDCGYGEALYRDDGSLSYVAEPTKGLWLIALDSCRYGNNAVRGAPVTGGGITPRLEAWLVDMLKLARQQGKTVIVMLHHGVVEHYPGQSVYRPAFLLDNYKHISELLATYGVRLVFTGHDHAQDIAEADFGSEGFLYDVETGSIVTPPCPVRFCTLNNTTKEFTYNSINLEDIYKHGSDFKAFADDYQWSVFRNKMLYTLKAMKTDDFFSSGLAASYADAYVAYTHGDENLSGRAPFTAVNLSGADLAAYDKEEPFIDGLWTDPSVKEDNNGILNLN